MDKIIDIIVSLCCINGLCSSLTLVAMLLGGQRGGKRRNLVTVNIEGGIILGYIYVCMYVDICMYVCKISMYISCAILILAGGG